MSPRPLPVIVVPGFGASSLRDTYPVTPQVVYDLGVSNPDRYAQNPEDRRYEIWIPGQSPSRTGANSIIPLTYQELIEELRYNLSPTLDTPTPVYSFAYDWRQRLEGTSAALESFIDEVIARTRLLPHYFADKEWMAHPRVHLVGHSMGGLVIQGYLLEYGGAKVGKVVSIATPFRGFIESIVQIATGTGTLGQPRAASRDREAARITPTYYYLLPDYPGSVRYAPGGAPADIFDEANWQPGVVDSLQEYVRLFGVDPAIPPDQAHRRATEILDRLLEDAEAFRQATNSVKSLADLGLGRDSWLTLIGVGQRTRIHLDITTVHGQPHFDLNGLRPDDWGTDPNSTATGDYSVAFDGATPTFQDRNRFVCLEIADFSPSENDKKQGAETVGLHAILPMMDLLQRIVTAYLLDTPNPTNIWGHYPPGVAPEAWNPPVRGIQGRPPGP
jgi:pimeloyl-ACP methyl ester carboxylesterase